MAIPVAMPVFSAEMTEGTLSKWLKKEGDVVKSGDSIAEVETDKSTLDVTADDSGTLLKIVVPAGTKVAVRSTIAIVGKPGEDISALLAAAKPAPASAPAPEAPKREAAPPTAAVQVMSLPKRTAPAAPPAAPKTAAPASVAAPASARGRVRASPLAKKMARAQGLSLAQVAGSGPAGRVVKRDVEAALAEGPSPAAAPVQGDTLLPLSTMRQVIADRLVQAKRDVPHFYLTVDIDMDRAMALRAELKEGGAHVTVNDLIVRACALGLVKVPEANRSYSPEGLIQHHQSDVGVAVALDEGLITPVVRGAEHKSVSAISAEIKSLVEQARARRLRPEAYTGGSMSVSNLGMYGVDAFIAVINPPQSCILAVGAVAERPAAIDGELFVRKQMTATLSCDHRAIDGATGAKLLAEIKRLLERPLALGF